MSKSAIYISELSEEKVKKMIARSQESLSNTQIDLIRTVSSNYVAENLTCLCKRVIDNVIANGSQAEVMGRLYNLEVLEKNTQLLATKIQEKYEHIRAQSQKNEVSLEAANLKNEVSQLKYQLSETKTFVEDSFKNFQREITTLNEKATKQMNDLENLKTLLVAFFDQN